MAVKSGSCSRGSTGSCEPRWSVWCENSSVIVMQRDPAGLHKNCSTDTWNLLSVTGCASAARTGPSFRSPDSFFPGGHYLITDYLRQQTRWPRVSHCSPPRLPVAGTTLSRFTALKKRPLCGKQGHESHFRKKCPQTSRSDCETEVLLCWAVFVVTRVSHMLMGHACDCCNSVQGLKPYFSELWTCVMKV